MSVEAISWALNAPLGGNAKVILLGLANHARPGMKAARPSVSTLMRYAHCDRRTVQRQLRSLESDGWIVAVGEHGRPDKSVVVYDLTGREFDRAGRQNAAGGKMPRAANLPERGGTSDASGAAPVPPKPLKGTVQEPSFNEPRADAPVKIGGKPVKPDLWQRTCEVLAEFERCAGRKAPPLTGAGTATEHAKRVYGRVAEYPQLSVLAHSEIIERTLASRWWWHGRPSGDPPSVGVVYGPRIFADNLDREPVRSGAGREAHIMRHTPKAPA